MLTATEIAEMSRKVHNGRGRIVEGIQFAFCEVGKNRRHDLRQGIVEPSELPAGLAAEAIAHAGVSIHYLTWPL
jgi:hypothetical protein